MIPLSLLAAQTFSSKLTAGAALQEQIAAISTGLSVAIPTIACDQIALSSAPADLADKNVQLSYPRVCLYSSNVRNSQVEKFRSFSGQVMMVAEIWASGDLITEVDTWIHFYVDAVASILQSNTGDWGNGMFYSGAYDVQFQPPKPGGLGFVEAAKLTFALNVSLS